MDDFASTMRVSAAGMRAQGVRLRVIAENIANADSAPTQPGEVPYRRQVVTFRDALHSASGADHAEVAAVTDDPTPFPRRFDPAHPAADDAGYVLESNVNPLMEMTDMREAERSYEANLNVIKASRSMLEETIEVLR